MPFTSVPLPALLQAYAAPLLAFLLSVAGALACRGKPRRGLLPFAAAAACLVGWATPLAGSLLLRAAWAPRTGPEMLLVPAAAVALVAAAGPWMGGRLQRWAPVGLAVFAGWWLAASPAGRPEFWRVWFAAGLLAWLVSRGAGGQPGRGLAGALALWGGLVLAGAPSGWIAAVLVAVAVWAGLLVAGAGALPPAALTAALIVGADLGAGRLMRGGLALADLACLAAIGAPFLAGPIGARLGKRLGWAGQPVAAIAAALISVGCAWLVLRVLRR